MSDIYKELLDGNESEMYYTSPQTYISHGISYDPSYENPLPHENRNHYNASNLHGESIGVVPEPGHDYYNTDNFVYTHPSMCLTSNETSCHPNILSLGPGELYSEKTPKTEKGTKGLRHFSMKVCEKVQRKGVTSYNEVADELVQELIDFDKYDGTEMYDQKNIRRRVYDALNVLMAMNIITKEKKEIRWLGLPTNSIQECSSLQNEKTALMEKVRTKIRELRELIIQHVCLKNLMDRNKELSQNIPPEFTETPDDAIIKLPFIVINASKQSVIDCAVSDAKDEYSFTMNCPFEIHDDIEVIKRLGLSCNLDSGRCSESDVNAAKKLLPKAFGNYIDAIANHTVEEFEESILSGNIFNVREECEYTPAFNYPSSNSMSATEQQHQNMSFSSYDYLPSEMSSYLSSSQRSQDQFKQTDDSFCTPSQSEASFANYHQNPLLQQPIQHCKINNEAFQYPLDDESVHIQTDSTAQLNGCGGSSIHMRTQ